MSGGGWGWGLIIRGGRDRVKVPGSGPGFLYRRGTGPGVGPLFPGRARGFQVRTGLRTMHLGSGPNQGSGQFGIIHMYLG